MTVKGKDSSRRRVIVTLLHGNEPSGLKAIHTLLSEDIECETDLGVMIAGVSAGWRDDGVADGLRLPLQRRTTGTVAILRTVSTIA